jgi:HAD superfamily hydrolase (TIGR01484 family)
MKFVFDLDGTICFRGKPVSEPIRTSLLDLIRERHEVIFASARPIRDMLPVLDERFHRCTLIGGNGSLISINGKVTHAFAFSAETFLQLQSLIRTFHAKFLMDGEWDYAYTGPNGHPILQNVDPAKLAKQVDPESLSSVVKILILSSDHQEKLAEKLSELDVVVNIHRNEDALDISPSGVSKWGALQALGVREGGYIAFGNDANDISMFEHALHSVMIGEYEPLSRYAKEAVSLEGEYEQKIAQKIKELSRQGLDEQRPIP